MKPSPLTEYIHENCDCDDNKCYRLSCKKNKVDSAVVWYTQQLEEEQDSPTTIKGNVVDSFLQGYRDGIAYALKKKDEAFPQ